MPSDPTPAEIQAEIEKTRADLAQTVDALADRVIQRKTQAKGLAVKVGAVAGAGLVVLVVVKIVKSRGSR